MHSYFGRTCESRRPKFCILTFIQLKEKLSVIFQTPLKMKIFEAVRKNYATLGISSVQSIRKHPFNKKIAMAFILIAVNTFCHIMHIFFVASNLKERMESATTTSGSLIITICIVTIILKMRTVFECIGSFEDIIAMSE